jgi:hypothetical protein
MSIFLKLSCFLSVSLQALAQAFCTLSMASLEDDLYNSVSAIESERLFLYLFISLCMICKYAKKEAKKQKQTKQNYQKECNEHAVKWVLKKRRETTVSCSIFTVLEYEASNFKTYLFYKIIV